MMRTIELASPAKINLYLDILGKRSDNYHDIVTVFERIDLCDTLRLTDKGVSDDSISITSNQHDLPSDENNLVFTACKLLKESFGVSKGVAIHIDKRIPIGAGLGGGSSNAATVLKGLVRLWGLDVTDDRLLDFGRRIGADVPFFIFNHAFAVGRQRGDEIVPIRSDLEMWHLLLTPPVFVSTREIYGETNLNLTDKKADVTMIVRAIEHNDTEGVKKNIYNALKDIAAKKVADISKAKDFLERMGFDTISVTGSGPTIFLITKNRKEAESIKSKFNTTYFTQNSNNPNNLAGNWNIFVAKTLQNSI